jgi:hypothetical protein
MPMVNGEKFPYTEKGKAAAKKKVNKIGKKMIKKQVKRMGKVK